MTIGAVWQISENVKILETGDQTGIMELDSIQSEQLLFENRENIILSSGSVTGIFSNVSLKVVNAEALQFYFAEAFPETDSYELRGNLANSVAGSTYVWNKSSFSGFYYTGRETVHSETLAVTINDSDDRVIDAHNLVYGSLIENRSFNYSERGAISYNGTCLFGKEYVVFDEIPGRAFELSTSDSEEYVLRCGQNFSVGNGYKLRLDRLDSESGSA
jgi:hypothetical protein